MLRVPVLSLALLCACVADPGPDLGDTDVVDTDPVETDPPDTGTPEDADGDGFPASVDCDETRVDVFPGATETCNGIDDDCDGLVDDADPGLDPASGSPWYPDADGDGAGADVAPVQACTAPAGPPAWVASGDDCDDADAARSPSAQETCNGVDDDCDALVDVADPDLGGEGAFTGYRDQDLDGWGDPATEKRFCGFLPAGWIAQGGDCADLSPGRNPGRTEACNGIDDDCDGLLDDADPSLDPDSRTTWAPDLDADGHGDADAVPTLACVRPAGPSWAPDALDCDDGDATVGPQAVERCGNGDEDCDELEDDDDPSLVGAFVWYRDQDGDGSVTDETLSRCADPGQGWVRAGLPSSFDDCDDDDATRAPHLDDTACDGHDAACTGAEVRLPEDAADLDAGLALLSQGGTLCLGPGTWEGNLVSSVPLVVRTAAGADQTTWVPADPGLRMLEASAPLTVRGLTFDGEDAPGEGAVHALADLRLQDVVFRRLRCPAGRCTGLAVHTEAPAGVPVARLADVRVEGVEETGGHAVLRGLALRIETNTSLDAVTVRGVRSVSTTGEAATVRGLAVELGLGALSGPRGLVVEDVELDHTGVADVLGGAVFRVGPWAVPLAVRRVSITTAGLVQGGAVRLSGSLGVGEGERLDLRDVDVVADEIEGGALRVDSARVDPGSGIAYEATALARLVVAGVRATASTAVVGGALSLSAGSGGQARHAVEHLTLVGVEAEAPLVEGSAVAHEGGTLTLRAVSLVDVHVTGDAADPVRGVGSWTESHRHLVDGTPPVDGAGSSVTGAPAFVAWDPDGDPVAWDLHPGAGSPLLDRAPTSGEDPDETVADIGAYGGPEGAWAPLP
ncbi:MAG: putative metal-binding motif-containing protein [Alphaproteobacteria bacterium]|nr:putative metal-binding motif-containing protein [Alphaproteobacteria bacterium]